MASDTMTAEPQLRVVDPSMSDYEEASSSPSSVPVPTQDQQTAPPVHRAAQQAASGFDTSLLKALAFEAGLFGIGGATAGVLTSPVRKRPRSALLGAMGSMGVYGLFRAVFGKGLLPLSYRIGAGVLGVALLGGSGYLAFYRKPGLGKPRRRRKPAKAVASSSSAPAKPRKRKNKRRRQAAQEA